MKRIGIIGIIIAIIMTVECSCQDVGYTDEEYNMMCWVVQSECGGLSDYHKSVVANLILNRVKSEDFPDTIKDVLKQRGQFTSISNYYYYKKGYYSWIPDYAYPTESTKQVIKDVLEGNIEDKSEGALYFYSPTYVKNQETIDWFEGLTFVLEIKEKSYSTTYIHRFFK